VAADRLITLMVDRSGLKQRLARADVRLDHRATTRCAGAT
jgi:hypothetical protein